MAIATEDDVRTLLNLGAGTTQENAVITLAIKQADAAIKRFLGYDPEQGTRTEFLPQTNFAPQGAGQWDVSGGRAVYDRGSQGSVGSELQLRHLPVRASTAIQVYVDIDAKAGAATDPFAAATLQTEGEDYWANYDTVDAGADGVCSDGILRSYGLWPSIPGSVKVVYVAGYTAAEFQGSDSAVDGTVIWAAAMDETVRRARKALAVEAKSSSGFRAGPLESERLGDYSYKVSSAALSGVMFGGLYSLLPSTQQMLSDAGLVNYGYAIAN